jgi:hypothetical protein
MTSRRMTEEQVRAFLTADPARRAILATVAD